MKKTINFFVSYAHSNKELANSFLEKLREVLAPSKMHDYVIWRDTGIEIGEKWEKQISEAIDKCNFGLLLVSPGFLASNFITERELPAFVSGKKPFIPVMLQPIDFVKHDLKGLESTQIFRLDSKGFSQPRAYGECRKQRRDEFILELFRAIENKLA